jgi:hypothetical protein
MVTLLPLIISGLSLQFQIFLFSLQLGHILDIISHLARAVLQASQNTGFETTGFLRTWLSLFPAIFLPLFDLLDPSGREISDYLEGIVTHYLNAALD